MPALKHLLRAPDKLPKVQRSTVLRILDVTLGALSLLFLAYLFFSLTVYAYHRSINFSGFAANGAFQVFNPLRRLADGQILGRDFQVFHGAGSVYILYPWFAALGKDLLASELARWIVQPILFGAVNLVFFRFFLRRWGLALFFTVVTTLLAPSLFSSLLYPQNALYGIRSAVPVLIPVTMVFLDRAATQERWRWLSGPFVRHLVLSFIVALNFFMSTEHGLASILAVSAVQLIALDRGWKDRFLAIGWNVLGTVGWTLLFLFALSGRYFMAPLKYALVDLPADQFWYFGAPPNNFMSSLGDPFKIPEISTAFGLGIFLLLILYGVYRRTRSAEAFALLYFVLYGLATTMPLLGYISRAYVHPLTRVEFLIVVWLLLQEIGTTFPGLVGLPVKRFGHGVLILLLVVTSFRTVKGLPFGRPLTELEGLARAHPVINTKISGVYVANQWIPVFQAMDRLGLSPLTPHNLTDANWEKGVSRTQAGFFIPYSEGTHALLKAGTTLHFAKSGSRKVVAVKKSGSWLNIDVDGPPLDPAGDGFPNKVRQRKPDIWSTYSGIVEASLGVYHPETDYIIHALGPERRVKYAGTFREKRPEMVKTMPITWNYEPWLMNTHWDFYEPLLENYDVLEQTQYGVFWERRTEGQWTTNTTWERTLTDFKSGKEFQLPVDHAQQDRVIVVKAKYRLDNPWAKVPFVGKLPRFFLYPGGTLHARAVSLPPYWTELAFPMLVPAGQIPKLTPQVSSLLPGVSMEVEEISYRTLSLPDETLKYLFRRK